MSNHICPLFEEGCGGSHRAAMESAGGVSGAEAARAEGQGSHGRVGALSCATEWSNKEHWCHGAVPAISTSPIAHPRAAYLMAFFCAGDDPHTLGYADFPAPRRPTWYLLTYSPSFFHSTDAAGDTGAGCAPTQVGAAVLGGEQRSPGVQNRCSPKPPRLVIPARNLAQRQLVAPAAPEPLIWAKRTWRVGLT